MTNPADTDQLCECEKAGECTFDLCHHKNSHEYVRIWSGKIYRLRCGWDGKCKMNKKVQDEDGVLRPPKCIPIQGVTDAKPK